MYEYFVNKEEAEKYLREKYSPELTDVQWEGAGKYYTFVMHKWGPKGCIDVYGIAISKDKRIKELRESIEELQNELDALL